MPGGDGTGPGGLGPMTGRAAGYCAGYPVPGCMNPIPGRGLGLSFGRGAGRGWRNWYWATGSPGWARAARGYPAFGGWGHPYGTAPAPKQEMDTLKQAAESLRAQLEEVQSRIATMEKAEQASTEEE